LAQQPLSGLQEQQALLRERQVPLGPLSQAPQVLRVGASPLAHSVRPEVVPPKAVLPQLLE